VKGAGADGGAGESGDASAATRERLVVIGEIAAEIAHELRNVLQIISASAYLARQDPAASLPHVAKIERNARLAHSIVDDLMALARGDALHAEPILLAEVMVAARSDLEGAAQWVDVIEPRDLRIRAHAGLAMRLLHVLYENAVGASAPRAPSITTRASNEGSRVVIEVSDDGPGIPPELAPRIFEPLVTGRAGGTGLGLALAKRIAAAHAGSVTLVESKSESTGSAGADIGANIGATFRLELAGA
jgi:signal transduction histidine kinase